MHKKFLFALLISSYASGAYAADINKTNDEPTEKWSPIVELEGRFNSDRSLFSPKLLVPIAQTEDSMLFTDIRSRVDTEDSQEYNLGIGYRKIIGDWIYGGYAFVDHLGSTNDFNYWQGTFGLEALSENWQARINGYLPESDENTIGTAGPSSTSVVVGGGGNLQLVTTGGGLLRERAMPGFDAEVGYKLPIDKIDLNVFAGMYRFDASGYKEVKGPKARIELTVGHDQFEKIPDGVEFTLGVQYQNDGPREDTTTALAQVRIPFNAGSKSKPKLSPLEKRMTTFIERDVDIVAAEGSAGGSTSTTENAKVTINGTDYTEATIVDGTTSDANATVQGAGVNSLVIFDGSKGNINVGDEIKPMDGQVLVGAGTSVTATGLTSNNTGSYTLGARPTLYASQFINSVFGTVGLTINDLLIRGIDINGGGNKAGHGIDLSSFGGIQGVTVDDVNITNVTIGNGIQIATGASNITLQNIQITNSSEGLSLISTDNVTLSNVSFSQIANDAIYIDNSTNVTGDASTNSVGNNCSATGTNTGSSISLAGGGTCP